jgi:hypothetical protein
MSSRSDWRRVDADQPDPIPGAERLSVDDTLVVAQQDISASSVSAGQWAEETIPERIAYTHEPGLLHDHEPRDRTALPEEQP